jgi:apolipoprotein N-acyltransferase
LLGAAAASGLALSLCSRMDPFWLPLLGVALVPWLAVLERRRTAGETVAAGLAMSVACVAGVFWWFALAISTYTGMPRVVACGLLGALAPLLEPQFVVFALVRRRLRRASQAWLAPLGSIAAYLATEWAFPKLFSDTLGHGLYPSPVLRQAADLAGVPGLTLIVLLANEAMLAAGRRLWDAGGVGRRVARALVPAGGALLLVAAATTYGAHRLDTLKRSGDDADAVTFAVVQSDIGQYARLAAEVGTYESTRRILDAYFTLSRQALARARPDVLVWPETAYPTTFGSPKSPEGAAFDREIADFVTAAGKPLVFGAYDAEAGREFNAAIILEPERGGGVSFDAYRKAALFPLIEHVPGWLDRPWLRRLLPWVGGWTPGEGADVFVLRLPDGRRLRVAPLICYDAAEPALVRKAVRRGAELILTLSNDSWFDVGAGPWLHLVLSAFRSVETHRAQVRATNTGISALITATGDLSLTTGVHERTVLLAQVAAEPVAPTLVLLWGDWLGPAAGAIALAALAAARKRERARGRAR